MKAVTVLYLQNSSFKCVENGNNRLDSLLTEQIFWYTILI